MLNGLFREIVLGKKKVLSVEQTRDIKVLRFYELDVKTALELVQQDANCIQFVPDHWLKPKARVGRSYL